MKELSLHILDLAQNSIRANANLVRIEIREDFEKDRFELVIEDNGDGMDKELLSRVTDPFITTRKTRKVGLGLSLMKAAALRCEGDLKINSQKGVGTKIQCYFKHSHIDRAPLGDIGETIMILMNNEKDIDIEYVHYVNDEVFKFTTKEVKKVLGDDDIRTAEVLLWIKDYVNEKIGYLHKNIEKNNSVIL
ncbi:ATP-binding protein [Caldisalinibacter kiritimatiensis]|uniref:histidine kinase n=1 Tax=Caldisalinibacter kiritimatiensis TaxID=1304284 RepID=R1CC09_9FIRM|nr:ATP-binding protein [Caldisalinibacter kiritimatiensis]EOC99839.1 Sensory transduction histidine kinase [Caldisalinibacter kiritimatiensis]